MFPPDYDKVEWRYHTVTGNDPPTVVIPANPQRLALWFWLPGGSASVQGVAPAGIDPANEGIMVPITGVLRFRWDWDGPAVTGAWTISHAPAQPGVYWAELLIRPGV